jgi:hypothetical protein
MDDKTKIPSGNVVPFRLDDRRKTRADGSKLVADSWDHGPSPEESLRVMRAFVAIKNRTLRANLTEMLEDASRVRGQVPSPAKE